MQLCFFSLCAVMSHVASIAALSHNRRISDISRSNRPRNGSVCPWKECLCAWPRDKRNSACVSAALREGSVLCDRNQSEKHSWMYVCIFF